jgi:hypothetical protein
VRPLHVALDIPGRLRLRLPVGALTESVPAAVADLAGVTDCAWSPRTRSLLILYDPEHGDPAAMVAAVARVTGLEFPAAAANGHAARREPGDALARGVRELFGAIDQRVQRSTRGLVGLGGLFPVALTAWAVAEVMRGRVAPLAWSSALWYAHGLFRDYQLDVTRD